MYQSLRCIFSQNIGSLVKIEALVKLHTVQMEGNPIWSLTEYSYHLVTALPKLTVLDQQEVSSEVRSNAQKWKSSQLGNIYLSMVLSRCAATIFL